MFYASLFRNLDHSSFPFSKRVTSDKDKGCRGEQNSEIEEIGRRMDRLKETSFYKNNPTNRSKPLKIKYFLNLLDSLNVEHDYKGLSVAFRGRKDMHETVLGKKDSLSLLYSNEPLSLCMYNDGRSVDVFVEEEMLPLADFSRVYTNRRKAFNPRRFRFEFGKWIKRNSNHDGKHKMTYSQRSSREGYEYCSFTEILHEEPSSNKSDYDVLLEYTRRGYPDYPYHHLMNRPISY